MHRHRFGTKLEEGSGRMTRWQDDTSHDNSSHHGQNSSRFLEVVLKKQINSPDFTLYSAAVMMVCPSHWDTVTRTFFQLSKKVNYTLSPWHQPFSPPCPGCPPMSSYNNGERRTMAMMPTMTTPRYGNTLLISQKLLPRHQKILKTLFCEHPNGISFLSIYWAPHNESYLFCSRRWWLLVIF